MTNSTFIRTDTEKIIMKKICRLAENHPLPAMVCGHFLAGIACVAAVSAIAFAGALPVYLITQIF